MKKIILAAAIVCAAAVSQAAAVGWTCMNVDSAYRGGDYSVFVLGQNGAKDVAQLQSIIAAGGLAAADDYALYTGGKVSSAGAASVTATASGKTIEYVEGGSAADNTWQAVIFVQSTDGTKASYTALNTQTLANNSTGKTFAFANQGTATASNAFTVSSVPEPTSGLLLLLGFAGLALKRRHA